MGSDPRGLRASVREFAAQFDGEAIRLRWMASSGFPDVGATGGHLGRAMSVIHIPTLPHQSGRRWVRPAWTDALMTRRRPADGLDSRGCSGV